MDELLEKKLLQGRSFLTLLDYSPEEIRYLLNLAAYFKQQKKSHQAHTFFETKNIVLLFEKTSTRTRCAFEVAGADLGMGVTYLDSHGSQMGVKESLQDTAAVLGRMYDGIEFRGFKQSDVEILAQHSHIPVWNGLTDEFHPTQVLADFLTIKEKKQKLAGLKFVYIGDAHNNVANSLMVGCAKMGIHFTAIAPQSLLPDQNLVERCKKIAQTTHASIICTDDLQAAEHADVIYTDVWVSMGEAHETWQKRLALLAEYQVNAKLMASAKPDALFLHCLPAYHGMQTEVGRTVAKEFGQSYSQVQNGEVEVTHEVFESPQSVVFDQAENRLHSIKAVLFATLI